jgi:hypothetical protein
LYTLDGKTDELRQQLGHQVEITGTPGDDDTSNINPNQPTAR